MAKTKGTTKEQFIEWLKRHGYTQDRYGHFQKVVGETTVRWKVTKTHIRQDRKALICGKNEWIRMRSGFLSAITINPDTDKLGHARNGAKVAGQ